MHYGEIYQRFVAALERLRDALIRAVVLPSPLLAVFGFVVEASFVAVAYAGSMLVLRDAIRPDVLLVFLVVTVGVVRQVAELGVALLMLRASQRALAPRHSASSSAKRFAPNKGRRRSVSSRKPSAPPSATCSRT